MFPIYHLRTISKKIAYLQPDEEIVIPQDDLYTITWETNFGEQLATRGIEPIPTTLPNDERPTTSDANSSNAHENETDYIITRDKLLDAIDAAHSRNERSNGDVSKRNEANVGARDENAVWRNPAVYHKTQDKSLPNLSDGQENEANFSEETFPNEIDLKDSLNKGDDMIVPEISQSDARNESLSPRGGNYNLRPNPNPNSSEDFRY